MSESSSHNILKYIPEQDWSLLYLNYIFVMLDNPYNPLLSNLNDKRE